MSRHPALALLATAVACFGIGGAVPSGAHLVAAEPVGNLTTITTTSSGTADVVLYDDATLSPKQTHNPDVTITGPGRVVGFTLTRTDTASDMLYVVRLPKFAGGLTYVTGTTTPAQPSCVPPTNPLEPADCPAYKPSAIKLHEGYYRLAVLTDGQPLRITLHLHGLQRASSRVGLQAKVRTAEADLPAREAIGSTTITYGAETAFSGATHTSMLVRAKLHKTATLLAASVCTRDDSASPPPYAFSPPCPGGANRGLAWSSSNSVRQEFGGVGGLSVYDLVGVPIQPRGVGGSFVDTDGPAYVGGVGVWSWGDAVNFFNSDFIAPPGQS